MRKLRHFDGTLPLCDTFKGERSRSRSSQWRCSI